MTCWSYDNKGVFKGWSYLSVYGKLLELRAHHIVMTCWSYDNKGVFKGWSYVSVYGKLLELRAHHSNDLLVL